MSVEPGRYMSIKRDKRLMVVTVSGHVVKTGTPTQVVGYGGTIMLALQDVERQLSEDS